MTELAYAVKINGEPRSISAGTMLADVLRTLGIDPAHVRGVAVAVNDEVRRRQEWERTTLQEGDRVEVVTARQGG